MDKTVFVLWSGGADSTAVIEHCLADEQYFAVLAGYVRVGNNAAKAEAELRAIEGMLPILQRTDKFVYQGVVMDLTLTRSNPNLAYKQVPIWLLALVAALHTPVSEVALGYIKNTSGEEDATTHLPDIERIYYAHQPLMHRPMPRLVFPLLHRSKAEVLAGLDPALRERCVYCEYPVREGEALRPCGKCRLCRKRAEELAGP